MQNPENNNYGTELIVKHSVTMNNMSYKIHIQYMSRLSDPCLCCMYCIPVYLYQYCICYCTCMTSLYGCIYIWFM